MDLQEIEIKIARRHHSPLFARLASSYLILGRIEEAKELCTAGLQHYPSYTTAHFVLAKCCAAQKDFSSALKHLEIAKKNLPDYERFKIFRNELKELVTTSTSRDMGDAHELSDNVRASIDEAITTPDSNIIHSALENLQSVTSVIEESSVLTRVAEIVPEQTTTEFPKEVGISDATSAVDANKPTSKQEDVQAPCDASVETSITEHSPSLLEEPLQLKSEMQIASTVIERGAYTAEHIQSSVEHTAQMDIPAYNKAEVDDRIVSKTLAEIYAMQGAFGEAIRTYQLLIHQRPELSAEFNQRIREIEAKLTP
jgi:tetratricopeptide (TPR) repeat protein